HNGVVRREGVICSTGAAERQRHFAFEHHLRNPLVLQHPLEAVIWLEELGVVVQQFHKLRQEGGVHCRLRLRNRSRREHRGGRLIPQKSVRAAGPSLRRCATAAPTGSWLRNTGGDLEVIENVVVPQLLHI